MAHPTDPLTPTELDRLLDAPLTTPLPSIVQARDAALLGMLACTGWRVRMVAALPRTALTDPGTPLSNHARHWCGVYLGRRRDAAIPLFVRHDRAARCTPLPLTPRSVERIVGYYGRRAGIAGAVTPRRIRAVRRAPER